MSKKNKNDGVFSERHYVLGDSEDYQGIISKKVKNYEIPDQKIESDAYGLIQQNSEIDTSRIRLEVNDGVLTLNGFVKYREHKNKIEEMMKSVLGVIKVYNKLEIKLYPDGIANNPSGLI
jgi:osmotically-inducible protein OsmY